MASRRMILLDLLVPLSKVLDCFISALLIILGLHLYFTGFEDIQRLITISSILLVTYSIKRILDMVGRSLASRKFEELVKRETK